MTDPQPGPGSSPPPDDPSHGDAAREDASSEDASSEDRPAADALADDCFAPPDVPIEVFCLHCGHVYMSDLMLAVNVDGTVHYACPVKGCDALGYKFDIFPVNDEDDADEDGGWVELDDEDWDEAFEDEFADDFAPPLDADGAIPFDPPQDWSPDADAEDGEAMREEETRYFTREDYEALKATGEYDRRAEEIRQWWRDCRDPKSPTYINDDDIPF